MSSNSSQRPIPNRQRTIPREDTDAVFDAFTSSSRRDLLAAIAAVTPEPADTNGGSVRVADLNGGTDSPRAVNLFHTHLPKLANMEFVVWDSDRDHVSAGPRFDSVRPLLNVVDAE